MNAKNTKTAALIHPEVVRPIETTLRSFGVRRQDLADGVAEVQARTLEYLRDKPMPAAIEEWAALCVTIARRWRLDEKKRKKTADKYCTGPCEDPDLHVGLEPGPEGRDLLDARRMLRELRVQFEAGEMPEKGEAILDCMQEGLDYQETAADLGLTAETVRMRMRRIRELFVARLSSLGIRVVVGVVLVGLASGWTNAAGVRGPSAPPSLVALPPPRAAA